MAIDFQPAQSVELGGKNPHYVSADFNGDGFDDFMVVVPNAQSGYDVTFLSANNHPKLPFQAFFKLKLKTRHMLTADFNGDGIADLAFSHYSALDDGAPDTIAIYLGTGRGFYFANSHTNIPTAHTPNVKVFRAFDANNDGLDDLLIDEHVRLSLGDGRFHQDTRINNTPLGTYPNKNISLLSR